VSEVKIEENDDYDQYRCSWENTGLTEDDLTYMEQKIMKAQHCRSTLEYHQPGGRG
jgi:hypothetical protein